MVVSNPFFRYFSWTLEISQIYSKYHWNRKQLPHNFYSGSFVAFEKTSGAWTSAISSENFDCLNLSPASIACRHPASCLIRTYFNCFPKLLCCCLAFSSINFNLYMHTNVAFDLRKFSNHSSLLIFVVPKSIFLFNLFKQVFRVLIYF